MQDATFLAGNAEWMDTALCGRSAHPEWWFPTDGAAAVAVAVCGRCPVRVDCLEYALANRIEDGIWGGESAPARRRIARQRRRSPLDA